MAAVDVAGAWPGDAGAAARGAPAQAPEAADGGPIARLREACHVIRELLEEGSIDFHGEFFGYAGVTTAAERVFIRGRDIPMVNRQTLLRDRYSEIAEPLPPQYRP